MKKILIATEKPFAKAAVDAIKEVADKNDGFELVMLESYTEKSELLGAVKDVDALIIRSDKATKEVIDAGDNLKIVVRAGAGYDNVDLEAATNKKVVVMNTPGQNSNAVAELAFGMMLNLIRKAYSGKAGTELRNKKIGIHAYGNVGKFIALIAKGFGMEVFAFDPFVADEKISAEGITPLSSVEELYSTCDFISLHIPVNDKTKKSINYELLSKMKKGGVLINTARKEVIDEEGLKKILEERDDLSYGSDLPALIKDELVEKFGNRVFFTAKKMGAQTSEANINAGIAAINQIIGYLENGDITFKVN